VSELAASAPERPSPRPFWHSSKVRLVVIAVLLASTLGYLGYKGFVSGASYYLKVPELQARAAEFEGKPLRVSGQLVAGSVQGVAPEIRFSIGEAGAVLPVVYQGVMPVVFERKDIPAQDISVLAEGQLAPDGTFLASNILVKCPTKWEAVDKGPQ